MQAEVFSFLKRAPRLWDSLHLLPIYIYIIVNDSLFLNAAVTLFSWEINKGVRTYGGVVRGWVREDEQLPE